MHLEVHNVQPWELTKNFQSEPKTEWNTTQSQHWSGMESIPLGKISQDHQFVIIGLQEMSSGCRYIAIPLLAEFFNVLKDM